MPGPNRAPRGGYQKPKDLKKTVGRLLGYLTRSKLPLLAVFGCLLASVCANIGGSYMMRGIINDFIWSGCTDFAAWAGPFWPWWACTWRAAWPPTASRPSWSAWPSGG